MTYMPSLSSIAFWDHSIPLMSYGTPQAIYHKYADNLVTSLRVNAELIQAIQVKCYQSIALVLSDDSVATPYISSSIPLIATNFNFYQSHLLSSFTTQLSVHKVAVAFVYM